jgi:hypothetical protein
LAENFHPDGEFPDSLNHHCFGEISAIFIEYFAGIRVNPYGDSCKEVNIEPCFVPQLTNAKAYHNTACGKVGVYWERNGGEITLDTTVAQGAYGEIRLPNGYAFKDSGLTYRALEEGSFKIIDFNFQSVDIIEV